MSTDDETSRESTPIGAAAGYQPALDRLRAITVLAVILYPLSLDGGLKIVAGGWLGVDIFSVLSGYLITALLLAEHERRGSIHADRFYIRRVLRLAPLSIGLVGVCLAIHLTGLAPHLGIDLYPRGALAILLYVANWMQLVSPGALASMTHTWSLSIEEQFYFVWPWIVIGTMSILRRRSRRVLIGFTMAAVIVMGGARRTMWLKMTGSDPSHARLADVWNQIYFSSLLRPGGLVFGCMAALVVHDLRITRHRLAIIRFFGIAGAAVATDVIVRASTPQMTFWLGYTAQWGSSAQNLGVALVVAWLVVEPMAFGARLLSWRPLGWIGRRAYGLYLFNPLVIAVLVRRFDVGP